MYWYWYKWLNLFCAKMGLCINHHRFLCFFNSSFYFWSFQIKNCWPNLLETPLRFSLSNFEDIYKCFNCENPSRDLFCPIVIESHEKIIQHVRHNCKVSNQNWITLLKGEYFFKIFSGGRSFLQTTWDW